MRFLVILVFFMSTTVCFDCFGQETKAISDQEVLANKVLDAIKSNDADKFKDLYLTQADCDSIVKKSSFADSAKIRVINQMKMISKRGLNNAEQNLKNIQEQAKQRSVDWAKVKINAVKDNSANRDNIPTSDIFILGEYESMKFFIKLNNCHKTDVWKLTDKVMVVFR